VREGNRIRGGWGINDRRLRKPAKKASLVGFGLKTGGKVSGKAEPKILGLKTNNPTNRYEKLKGTGLQDREEETGTTPQGKGFFSSRRETKSKNKKATVLVFITMDRLEEGGEVEGGAEGKSEGARPGNTFVRRRLLLMKKREGVNSTFPTF